MPSFFELSGNVTIYFQTESLFVDSEADMPINESMVESANSMFNTGGGVVFGTSENRAVISTLS